MSKPSDSKALARQAKPQAAVGVDRRRFFMMGGSAQPVFDGRFGGRGSSRCAAHWRRGGGGRVAGRARQGALQGDRSRQELLSRQPLLMGQRTC